jgi:hypothetical protein
MQTVRAERRTDPFLAVEKILRVAPIRVCACR